MRKQSAAVGVLSFSIVTRLSHILEKTTQRAAATRNLGRERKERVEEEGEIDAAAILHAQQ